jgi:cobalt/nickel transport system permease protein
VHEKSLTLPAPPHTFLEHLDPRIKMVALLVWAVCVVTVPERRPVVTGVYAALLILLLLTNGRLYRKFTWRFGTALPFVLVLTVLLPFFKAGQPLWTFGPFELTRAGLWTALRVASAATLCIAAVALVWASTSEASLLAGLRGIGLPGTFVDVLGFMLRYLHVLRPELHRLNDARLARAIGPHGPGALRSGANVLGTLFLRAHERAECVADAMAARGFAGPRRTLNAHHWHVTDLLLGALFIALVVLVRLLVRA